MPLLGATGGGSAKGFGALANLGYFIRNSLRFRKANSAYLSRTPGSASNRRTWTWSGWVKRGLLSSGTVMEIYYANNSTTLFDRMYFHNSNGTFQINGEDGAALAYSLVTTQVFRDPSAWYHIVFAFDTTQATASNRIKLYVNGVQVTAFSTASYPSLNYDTQVNNNVTQYIGTGGAGASDQLFDGYLAEAHFIDGQALTPSSFGKTDTLTNQWIPKKFAGTYGTNGFYLKFADASAATAAAIGKDTSPNGNNWTPNNISVTAGVTYDAMIDSPTLTSATVANYCTLNPLFVSTSTISNANLQVATTLGTGGLVIGTIGGLTTGKYYWEATIVSQTNNPSNTPTVGIIYKLTGRSSDYLDTPDGDKFVNPSAATNDILGVAVDFDSGSMSVYKNNTLSSTVLFTSSLGWHPAFSDGHGNQTTTLAINFGQRPFAYTPPTGFKSLNAFNLP
jgi:hypothetical protein